MDRERMIKQLTRYGKGTFLYYASLSTEELKREMEAWGNVQNERAAVGN